MPNEVPTYEVIGLQKQGKSTQQITQELQNKGYSLRSISEAMNQSSIKSGVEGAPTPDSSMQESVLGPEDVPVPPEAQMPEVPTPEAPARRQAQSPMPAYPQMQPAMQQMMPQQPSINYEDVQSLVEEVIDEKWKELVTNIGDIVSWKSQMANETEAIKQELLRVEQRFETMQGAVLGKVREYNTSIQDLGSDMKALEKVFEKIIEPLTNNIKELDRITGQLKGRQPTK